LTKTCTILVPQEAKMPKLTDTQIFILSRAAARPDNVAMPLPKGLHGAAAQKAVAAMIAKGWLEEVDANLHHNEPLWRETGYGHGTTLIATEAGLAAIGVAPQVATVLTNLRKGKSSVAPQVPSDPSGTPEASKAPKIRAGTKQAQIIALLQRSQGASIVEIVDVTGWAPHSARGMISGALKKKLGLEITTATEDERGRIYHIQATK
jgi:hypothetical protein